MEGRVEGAFASDASASSCGLGGPRGHTHINNLHSSGTRMASAFRPSGGKRIRLCTRCVPHRLSDHLQKSVHFLLSRVSYCLAAAASCASMSLVIVSRVHIAAAEGHSRRLPGVVEPAKRTTRSACTRSHKAKQFFSPNITRLSSLEVPAGVLRQRYNRLGEGMSMRT